jgi:hypothetical protein
LAFAIKAHKLIRNCRTYTAHRLSLLLRFLAAAIRTLVDPADPNDRKTAHALQDALKV